MDQCNEWCQIASWQKCKVSMHGMAWCCISDALLTLLPGHVHCCIVCLHRMQAHRCLCQSAQRFYHVLYSSGCSSR